MNPDEPTPVLNSLGAAGVCPTVEHGGKSYRLGHPTQVVKADFELAVIEAEKRSIAQQVKHSIISPAEASAEKAKLGAAIDRRDHQTGKPLWLAYVFRHPETGDTSRVMTGLLIFVHCLFRQNHPDMTFAEVQEIADGAGDDLKLALKTMVPSYFRWAGTLLGLPAEAIAQLSELAETTAGRMFPAPPTPTTPTSTTTS